MSLPLLSLPKFDRKKFMIFSCIGVKYFSICWQKLFTKRQRPVMPSSLSLLPLQYLSTPESLLIVPELVRFVCCVIHPPNEILQSDIVPRWAFIGWLLSLCQVSSLSSAMLGPSFPLSPCHVRPFFPSLSLPC